MSFADAGDKYWHAYFGTAAEDSTAYAVVHDLTKQQHTFAAPEEGK